MTDVTPAPDAVGIDLCPRRAGRARERGKLRGTSTPIFSIDFGQDGTFFGAEVITVN